MTIVIGSVVGLVFLILCVILGIHIVRTVRKNRNSSESPDDGEVALPKDGMRYPVDRRFWQVRGNSMQMPRETAETRLQDAYDGQRMNVISKAMERVSNIVSNDEISCNQHIKMY